MKKVFKVASIAILLAILALGAWWTLYLKKAHSTFENQYTFRGCTQLIEKTDTYGICKTKSGQAVKIVLYEGRWFLDGDLPYN